jgi:Flp pilus assembly protein TadB
VSLALAAGALAGLGVVLMLSVVFPRPVSLAAALTRLGPEAPPGPDQPAGSWWGPVVAPVAAAVGLPRAALAGDLRLCGVDGPAHAAQQAAAALAGLLAPPAAAGLLWTAGAPVGWLLPAWTSLAAAVAGAAAVDLRVRRRAAALREQLRHALSVQLDLTMMGLAAGAGVEQALTDAAAISDRWAHRQLRHALHTAAAARLPIWDTLAELGRRTSVPELVELAAAVNLAGQEGARIRATLAARAAALRQRHLSETEAAAAAATERMALPAGLLFIGFLLTILYPAVSAVVASL